VIINARYSFNWNYTITLLKLTFFCHFPTFKIVIKTTQRIEFFESGSSIHLTFMRRENARMLGWWRRTHLASSPPAALASSPAARRVQRRHSPPWFTGRCPNTLPDNWLTTAASSPTLTQEYCAQRTLVRFSSVGRAPTSATEPSMQLDLESVTICRRTSDTYSRFRQWLKTFLFGE